MSTTRYYYWPNWSRDISGVGITKHLLWREHHDFGPNSGRFEYVIPSEIPEHEVLAYLEMIHTIKPNLGE